MDRKIIIKAEDLERETHSFLREVSTDMPLNWNADALALVRDAVIEAFGRMGVILEVDERFESSSSLFNRCVWERKGEGMNHLEKGGKR